MADRLWRVQCSIPLDSGVPEDAIVNTWHFDDDDDPVASATDTSDWIVQQLSNFYSAIDQIVFPSTVSSPMTLKMYDMAEPEPRIPIDTAEITVTPSANPPLPNEVALCLSFAAEMESGVRPSRRRGRIFLGPVQNGAAEVVNSQLRPTFAVRDAVRNAANELQTGFEHPGSPGFRLRWSIYSPRTRETGGTVGQAFNDVLSGWVDNAFDTQRRRGPAPTTRDVFTAG